MRQLWSRVRKGFDRKKTDKGNLRSKVILAEGTPEANGLRQGQDWSVPGSKGRFCGWLKYRAKGSVLRDEVSDVDGGHAGCVRSNRTQWGIRILF